MLEKIGRLIDSDVLVVGGGAGGLWAALSAKRHFPEGRITLVDAHMVGRTGHTAFSNAWMVMVSPEDDLDACVRDIVEGNEWIAEQELIREVLSLSYGQVLDLERMGLRFAREGGQFVRRPTRGLRVTKVLKPVGGGLEFCWVLRKALESEGIRIVERIFVTDLLQDDHGWIAGAAGIDGRSGEFCVLRAKATVLATNSVTFRAGFVRDLTGTGPVLAYRAGAAITNAEFGYLRPATPKFYFEGITFAIQDGAKFVNAAGEPFMEKYEPDWADQADVQLISKAMVMEKRAGKAPLYLDMSLVPEEKREDYLHSTVAWMDYFYKKLGERARIDMFGRTEYYPFYQMTKMAIKTDSGCRASLPGLFAAGLAQASCATHFAGFHIGACNGTGWIAGRSAAALAREVQAPAVSEAGAASLKDKIRRGFGEGHDRAEDELLFELQKLIFRYDLSILKTEERLSEAVGALAGIEEKLAATKAGHTHGFVRLRETEAMVEAAKLIFIASRARQESRLSHIREDFPKRDDRNWLRWVLLRRRGGEAEVSTEPIATPLVPPPREASP
ncbi:MAG TPA: FAD-binding protein [candidate division Zixibacteria bacterium]|nr:FAD-binding protein [candidate division Zixibacteria bacterium]